MRRAFSSPFVPAAARRRRYYLAFTAAFPLVLLLLLEVVLRLLQYGPDLSLFSSIEVHGRQFLAMNPSVSSRYFFRTDFQPGASPDVFRAQKQPGSIRIFCLGASTTVGYPYWYNASFSSFLRGRLEAIFPDRPVEVVNLGMTATNSFTVLDMAAEAVRQQPDAIVVYDGHNEFYGALGVASRESAGQSRWLVTTYLGLLRFKSFLLVRDLYAGLEGLFVGKEPSIDRSTMMERMAQGRLVPIDGALYRRGTETFRENVQATAALCGKAGVPLLLCTQVSNLRDLPPFASLHAEGIMQDRLSAFDELMRQGDSLRALHDLRSAASMYRSAALLDSCHAAAHFRLAVMLDSLGDNRGALGEYRRARDTDPVRFRASDGLNEVIRSMHAPVIPVDIEGWFAEHSRKGIVGAPLIMEHLHPTAYGQFLISQAVMEAMRRHGLLSSFDDWQHRDTLGEEALWQHCLVTPLDERIARRKTEFLTSGWPFRPATVPVSSVDPDDTLGQIAEQVMRGRWNWYRAHEAALGYFEGRREDRLVEKEYAALVSESPLDADPRFRYARFLMKQGRLDEMSAQLRASLEVRPTILAYRALGDAALRAGRPKEAVGYYVGMRQFPQDVTEQIENCYVLGVAFLQAGSRDSASAELRRVLAIKPEYLPAATLLRQIEGTK